MQYFILNFFLCIFSEPYDVTVVIPSVLNIIHGQIVPMDLVKVQTEKESFFSFLSVGWGLMADIDIESERLRAIGEARFAVWGVIRALGKFKICVHYINEYLQWLRPDIFQIIGWALNQQSFDEIYRIYLFACRIVSYFKLIIRLPRLRYRYNQGQRLIRI